MVAVLEDPPKSVTLTTKVLVPPLNPSGVPERVPLASMLSQVGPLTLANVRISPAPIYGAVALVAIVPA